MTPDTPLLLMGRSWTGYGDAIQAARFVPLLVPQHIGPRVLVATPSLARLFRRLGLPIRECAGASVGAAERELGLYDAAGRADALLLSSDALIAYAGSERLPWPLPVDPVPPPASLWADDRIRLSGGRRHLGLCWNSGACRVGCSNTPRDVPPEALRPLLRTSGFGLVALQLADSVHRFADHAPVLRNLPESRTRWVPSLADLGARDFADTAGVIRQLALVITVDTAIAHLAGSLGVPTFVLLPFAADERWGVGETPPWYPNVRIFRQPAPGAWDPVVARVAAELAARPVRA